MHYTTFSYVLLIIGLPLVSLTATMEGNTTTVHPRKKRYLSFPDGSVLQLSYCMQIVALLRSDMILGYNVGINWDLPNASTLELYKSGHKTNNFRRRHRRDLYKKLETLLNFMGLDGQACILRTLCEAARRTAEQGSFLQEILYTIFTFPARHHGDEEDESYHPYDRAHRAPAHLDCSSLFPTCEKSLFAFGKVKLKSV